jgi:hypothetical protein
MNMYNYFLKARVSLRTLSSLVINLFTQVAIVLELALVSSQDFPDVQVGNWMDWQPREAIKGEGEELQSNLTLEEVEKLASEVPISDDDKIVDFEETIVVDVE